jgi:hypothetical protein
MPVSALALGFVLLQAAAAIPSPAPTPTPSPRPPVTGPRTLQDVARERKLAGAQKGKGSLVTISGGPSTGTPAPAGTPEAAAAPSATPEPAASTASVRVTEVTNDGVVDPTGGVRVNGTVRNGGFKAACNVVITVRIMDNKGIYLASADAAPDTAVIPPGAVVSFRTIVQAPPGVRGARVNPDRRDVTDGSTSMAGDWKLLGGTEATVASATEDCAR